MIADPRIEAIAKVAWEHPGGREFRKHADPFETVSPDVQRMYRKEARLVLDAADAVDPLRQPGWVHAYPTPLLVERLCRVQHDAYEDAAVREGWQTQERSRRPWDHVPLENKATMRASMRAVLAALPVETQP